MQIGRNTLYLICLLVVLSLSGGCTGLSGDVTVPPPQLTVAEQVRVGSAVEAKLIQMLGGPYHDQMLAKDLNRLVSSAQPFSVSVADKSTSALYPLPGGRVIVTRGLLSRMKSRTNLKSLLTHALSQSNNVYAEHSTHSVVEATDELLSGSNSIYAPDSAAIRLARFFEREACIQECLALAQSKATSVGKSDLSELPESVKRLAGLQPGYELAASARKLEKDEAQAKAIALYLQAAAITADEPRILGALGLAYLRAGQLQPARLHLQKAVKLQPDYYRTQMGLGYLYLQQGKFTQANQTLAMSVRMLPMTENLFLLAEAREKSDDVEGAMLLYRLIVETDRSSKLGRASAGRLEKPAGVK